MNMFAMKGIILDQLVDAEAQELPFRKVSVSNSIYIFVAYIRHVYVFAQSWNVNSICFLFVYILFFQYHRPIKL